VEHSSTLVLIAVAAFLLPFAAARLVVPAVVLELIFGAALRASGLNIGTPSAFLDEMAHFGFLLLMFISGFELDLRSLRAFGMKPLVIATMAFAGTVALSFLATSALHLDLFVTFMLATTSVGLVIPTLRSTGHDATPLGRLVLITAMLADFVTLLGVTVYALIREEGTGVHLLGVPVFFAVALAAFVALRRVAWWHPQWFQRIFHPGDTDEMGIRATLALMLAFVGLSEALGIEAILGAFLAGAIFAAAFREHEALDRQLNGFAFGFLIPLFFINVGLNFDARTALSPAVLWSQAGLIAAAVMVKVVPSFLFVLNGLRVRDVLAASALLSARLSLIIAVAQLGVRLGLIDQGVEAGAILIVAISALTGPAAFRRLASPAPPRAV
jgi:Kef-type K+ transport system membrane component KefB